MYVKKAIHITPESVCNGCQVKNTILVCRAVEKKYQLNMEFKLVLKTI